MMADHYAVIGNPIEHSKSPLIHEAFARQTGQDIQYTRILAPLDGFVDTVTQLMAQGYKGVNVTVPFKFEAFRMATALNPHAKRAGAANTLIFNQSDIIADNTDGIGLVRDITENLRHGIAGKNILLLGAGGAAEGVLYPLLDCRPKKITLANRTAQKAIEMVKKVQSDNVRLEACEFAALRDQTFDLVINATSAGLTDAALPIPDAVFAPGCLAYDMMYGRETPFMRQAKAAGAQVADGLGMLVEQAAEAFYLWRNVRPLTAPVIEMIRAL